MHLVLPARALALALGVATATAAAAQSRGAPRPAAEPAPPPREVKVETDGDRAVGHWGIAYFGSQTFRFGDFNGAPNTTDVFTAGVRRWIGGSSGSAQRFGFDAGVGLAMQNVSHQAVVAGAPATFKASATGLALHAGLPIALAQGRHITFLALPEVDALYVSGGNDYPGPARTKWSGSGMGFGAKAGFELYFGFLGMPQFALEGTVGLALRYTSSTSKLGNVKGEDTTWRFGTDKPLGFVVGNIAAVYYY